MNNINIHLKNNVPKFQESYWRIPNTLNQIQLRELCEMIDCAIKGTLNVNHDTPENTTETLTTIEETTTARNEESSDDDDLFDKLRQLRTGNVNEISRQSTSAKGNVMQTASSSQFSDKQHEDDDEDISTQEIGRFRRALLSECDDSDVSIINENASEKNTPASTNLSLVASSRYEKRIRQIVSSDSDTSEEENIAREDESPVVAKQVVTFLSDSDGETTKSTKRRRILDSDDDA